jgi:arylsulfatase
MKRNVVLYSLGIALTMSVARAQSSSPSSDQNKKPNIVFTLMDNLGYGEPGCYGSGLLRGAATPRIDKLATEGTRLTNFNVEAHDCRTARRALNREFL